MKIEQTQCGQDRKYGDFYYKYKITTEEKDFEKIFEEVNEILKTTFEQDINKIITSSQYHNEDNCAGNHFRDYFYVKNESYGFLLVITSPSTH